MLGIEITHLGDDTGVDLLRLACDLLHLVGGQLRRLFWSGIDAGLRQCWVRSSAQTCQQGADDSGFLLVVRMTKQMPDHLCERWRLVRVECFVQALAKDL